MISRLILVVAICSVLSLNAQIATNAPAPDFHVTAFDRGTITLSKLRGKVVLLNFWATWCTPCQTEIPRFNEFQRELGPKGFEVIGISMDDSPAPVRTFIAKAKVQYPIAMGNAKLGESYGGVLGLPITFLIDRQGRIAKRYEGIVDLDSVKSDIQQLLKVDRNHPDRDHQ